MTRIPATEPNELSQLLVRYVNDGDIAGIVALYEEDAVLDTGNGDIASGSPAIAAFWERFVGDGVTVHLGRQAEPLVNGDIALTSTRLPNGTVTAEVARRQVDGSWKWVLDQAALPTAVE